MKTKTHKILTWNVRSTINQAHRRNNEEHEMNKQGIETNWYSRHCVVRDEQYEMINGKATFTNTTK